MFITDVPAHASRIEILYRTRG